MNQSLQVSDVFISPEHNDMYKLPLLYQQVLDPPLAETVELD